MSTEPSSEHNSEKQSPNQGHDIYPETLQDVHQQHLNLKLEVEQLYRKVELMRGLFQTLVSGLVIAIVIAIGISSWFAYRLLTQEQRARQEAAKAAATQKDMLKQVEQLEQQLQSLSQQVQEELPKLTDATQASQQELQQLRDRLAQVEAKQRKSGNPSSTPREPARALPP
ncbi:MAG: hypothetical protein AB4426_28510 [Xenococcaceae cyanobacterium]